jgi:hypothetical protein
VVDSYFPIAPEMLLLANGLKQFFAFGYGYSVVPWIHKAGYKGAFEQMAAIHLGVMALGLPLWYFGKRIRQSSWKWKVLIW